MLDTRNNELFFTAIIPPGMTLCLLFLCRIIGREAGNSRAYQEASLTTIT